MVTCFEGQPMLMSIIWAPCASAMRAPSAIQCGSQPASWTTRIATPLLSERTEASRSPRTKPAQAVISETTSPAPSRSARRRNGASVIPDIGARITRFGTQTVPMDSGGAGNLEISPDMG